MLQLVHRHLVLAGLAALILAVLVLSAAPPRADGAFYRKCPDVSNNFFDIKAHNRSCREAKNVLEHYHRNGFPTHFKKWTCRQEPNQFEGINVECKRFSGAQQVKWKTGA